MGLDFKMHRNDSPTLCAALREARQACRKRLLSGPASAALLRSHRAWPAHA